MTIRVIDDPEVTITRSQEAMYRREWERLCQYNAYPPTFESYVREQQGLAADTEEKQT